MFRSSRRFSAILQVDSFLRTRQYSDLSKFLTTTPRASDATITEEDWTGIVDRIIKDESALSAITPALLISTAAKQFSLSSEHKILLSKSLCNSYTTMSQFDKIVATIGVSQLGIRTPEVISVVSEFLSADSETVPEKFIPSILLAMANLAINNQRAWGTLIARVPVESLSFHSLANLALAVATSRSFPISLVERIVDTTAASNLTQTTIEDVITLAHSLTCLEVYRTDLFRSLLDKLSRERKFDSDTAKFVKQIVLAVHIDSKAKAIIDSIAPDVWHRFDRLLDWTIPEPQRIHGTTDGEIQQLVDEAFGKEGAEDTMSTSQPLALPNSIADWTREIAQSVAADRFYLPDISSVHGRVFVHIDDETFPDCVEGPIDPFIQIKHQQITQCGYKLVWIREQEWLELEDDEEKRNWLKSLLLE